MIKKIFIPYIVLIGVLLASCEDQLDPLLDSTYPGEFAYGLPEGTEGILMNAYMAIPNRFDHFQENFLDVATDNAVTNAFGTGIYRASTGGINPLSNPVGNWDQAYTQFRHIHLFLDRGLGDGVIYNVADPTTDSLTRVRLKGEAFFLRAWWGFRLLQDFGGKTNDGSALGYPIVIATPSPSEERDLEGVRRNTYEECVQQVLADCDTAIAYLPVDYNGPDLIVGSINRGRASQLAAYALKSRVSLYAASPAYQPGNITQITGMGQFSITGSAEYQQKWERAAQLSQEAVDLVGAPQSLRANLFNPNQTPAEFIWRKYFNNRNMELAHYPPYAYGNAHTGPSQNLVDAFPMQNGFPITDPRSGYDPQDPYQGRDPRLDLVVFYNGRTLNGSPIETFVGGKDSRQVNQEATRTGYYLRKWLSVRNNLLDPENPSNDNHYYALFRRTEVHLNLAEAANEAYGPAGTGPGVNQSALEIIRSIRDAAGIGNDTYVDEVAAMGQDAFRELIQNERRLELAFENHRFYDMRRWLLLLDETIRGIEITKDANDELQFSTIEVEERNFSDIRDYYQPLPYDELMKSPNMINNLGW